MNTSEQQGSMGTGIADGQTEDEAKQQKRNPTEVCVDPSPGHVLILLGLEIRDTLDYPD